MKKIIVTILIVFLLLSGIFWLAYIKNVTNTLNETSIQEDVIITFEWKEWTFILNPNTWEFWEFSWEFDNKASRISNLDEKIYDSKQEYYYKKSGLYDNNEKLIMKSWLYPSDFDALWTQGDHYLIRTDGHVVKMFWLFFSTPTTEKVIHVLEPSTKKSKQILLYDEKWLLLKIDKILWSKSS